MRHVPSPSPSPARHVVALALAVTLGAASLAPRTAAAEDRTAETLYQEGRAAAQVKDWPIACAKFAESQAREPAPGTLLNLGDCEENRGQFAQAIAHFEAAARLCKPGDERAEYARKRSFALERRAPKLTLRMHPSSPAGTTVERDGVAVPASELGTPVPMDLGEHALVVHAPGRADTRGSVRLAAAETRDIELTVGMPIPGAGASAGDRPGTKPAGGDVPPPSTASPYKTAGYVSLGIGAVGLGVGILGGVLTLSAKSTADAHCPTQGCDPDGLAAESRGKTWSTVSTAGFVVGGVGLVAGAGLLLFAPKKQASVGAIAVTPTAGGAQLRWAGTF